MKKQQKVPGRMCQFFVMIKNRLYYMKWVFMALVLFGSNCLIRLNAQQYAWNGSWLLSGKIFPYKITLNKKVKENAPVTIYLTALKTPRIGTDTDEQIINDMMKEDYLVVVLDCSNLTDSLWQAEAWLTKLNEDLPNRLIEATGAGKLINTKEIYFIPAGYRIARNQPFWNIKQHAAPGTLDYIVRSYNKNIVKKYKKARIQNPDQLKGPHGQSLDYELHMDIIYPSGAPKQSVPLVINFATQSVRMSMFSAAKDGSERMIYPIGFLLSGYAWANADHNFNPLVRDENYGFMHEIYTLDHWNGLASSSAAIRYLRAHANQYHLNGKIGAMGISKASYSVTRLADPGNDTLNEYKTFGVAPNNKVAQPWPGFSSTIDVGYTAAGMGIRRLEYINKKTVPLVTSAGRFDKFRMWELFPTVQQKFEEVELNYLDFWMEDQGHTYPVGTDYVTGLNRYALVKHFFDQQLYPLGQSNLEVLYILPANGSKQVLQDGCSSRFRPGVALPQNMNGCSLYSPITVRFARSIKAGSVSSKTVQIRNDKTLKEVKGQWFASLQNTRFEFLPAAPLDIGTSYSIEVSGKITDVHGNALKQYPASHFTVREFKKDE